MLEIRTPRAAKARPLGGVCLLVVTLLVGLGAWAVVAAAGRPARAATPPAAPASVPLDFIELNRNPAPPNCVLPGQAEAFNWTITFSSIPDHYVYSITDPLNT